MEVIKNWIIGICAGAIICAIAGALAPKGKSGNAVKLACGFMTVALLIGPISTFDFQQYAQGLSELKSMGDTYAGQAINMGGDILKSVIESDCETYILDKAEEIGISGLHANVSAEIEDGEDYPYPYSVELGGEAEGEQRKRLSSYIEGELGIPAERQDWSGENET